MRCPKCGFNSFDHLENCKKCGKDLTEHKSRFGIKNILLSGVILGAKETVETEEIFDTGIVPKTEETPQEPALNEPVAEAESDDFGFDFMGDSDEEENLAFDELFEETPLEDDVDETLPAPDEATEDQPGKAFADDGLEDPSAFDLGESENLESDFGLDESDSAEENLSTDTDLGLDETDFTDFDEDDTLGSTEDPARPFDGEEVLLSEEPPESDAAVNAEEPLEELPDTPLSGSQSEQDTITDDPFAEDEELADVEFLFEETTTAEAPPSDLQPDQDPVTDDLFAEDEELADDEFLFEEATTADTVSLPEGPADEPPSTPPSDLPPDQDQITGDPFAEDEELADEEFLFEEVTMADAIPLPEGSQDESLSPPPGEIQPEQDPVADDPFVADAELDLGEPPFDEALATNPTAILEEPAEELPVAARPDVQPEQVSIGDDPFAADADFDQEEILPEDPVVASDAHLPEVPAAELSIASLPELQPEEEPASDDPFIADEDFQEELFAADEELPPLPDTALEEQPLESLEVAFRESSYDRAPVGESDDFTLGALPAAQYSDEPEPESTVAQESFESEQLPEASEPIEDSAAPLEEQIIDEESDIAAPPFSRRLSAFFCDIILLGLVGFCFIIVAETALSESTNGIFPSLKTLIDLSIPYFLVVFCLTFGYFTLFHFLAGQTPGKMVTGLRVETSDGEAIAFSQAFMRSVGGLIQTLPIGLGYLTVLLDRDGRGWNDRLAGTRLIDLKNFSEEQEEEKPDEPEEA